MLGVVSSQDSRTTTPEATTMDPKKWWFPSYMGIFWLPGTLHFQVPAVSFLGRRPSGWHGNSFQCSFIKRSTTCRYIQCPSPYIAYSRRGWPIEVRSTINIYKQESRDLLENALHLRSVSLDSNATSQDARQAGCFVAHRGVWWIFFGLISMLV